MGLKKAKWFCFPDALLKYRPKILGCRLRSSEHNFRLFPDSVPLCIRRKDNHLIALDWHFFKTALLMVNSTQR
jgi:hypothetical protein